MGGYEPKFEFTLAACNRLDAAEEIYHRITGIRKSLEISMTVTQLSYFTEFRAYKAVGDIELKERLNELEKLLINKVGPFFDENQDVESLNRLVNQKTPNPKAVLGLSPSPHLQMAPDGPMHSVIIARLARNSGFDELVAKHRRAMRLQPTSAHEFNELVQYLLTIW